MTVLAATTGPTLWWYLARGSGIAALVVLTLSMVLGIVTSVRWRSPRWPRFVIELLHRNSSLVAFGLIVVHVSAVVLDGFAPIGWKDAVLPFASPYRTLWLGLGTVAFDLLLALLVTSLLRHRVGHRTWRVVHWFAYVCWPLVVVHGLATGTDTRDGVVFALTVACVVAVLMAVWWRIAVGWPDHLRVRVGALAASLAAPLVLVVWVGVGPLAAGWAARAGTPASVLHPSGTASSTPATGGSGTGGETLPSAPFTAQLAGSLSTSAANASGRVTERLALTLQGGTSGTLEVDLIGAPEAGGGVLLDTSGVRLGTASDPELYTGQVVALRGDRIEAIVAGTHGQSLDLTIEVSVDGSQVSGTLNAQPAGAGDDAARLGPAAASA